MEYCPLEFQSGCAITTSRLGCRWIDRKEGEGEMMSIRLCVDTPDALLWIMSSREPVL